MAFTRIDRETVQKIIDTADIVEVVSDFVTLKRAGANYVGLCPFHNERTPSFSVSRAKGICKCFSCGKGGSAVGFIMEHEQLGYYDALRYLAKKYNIEIQEKELTEEERQEESERQAMLSLNEMAMRHFKHNLLDTPEGRDIGLTYFRQRGINDWAIERFSLGYSSEKRNDLLQAAQKEGYKEKYLTATGLVSRNDRGELYDRFRGRVMYPVFTVAGKVVAFGGRTLRSDKTMAKYVNSPESSIYSKSHELYGLFQAKQAIAKKNQCILVEGYMDVISMHQKGVENVVASSGTSLTEGQTRLIHRFTENVLLIYDSDAAGIKASLRGVDILLAEGLNIKILLLPDGDDPDSFAQAHSTTEIEDYLAKNQQDFIRFKSQILLKDAADDPIARSRAISSIVSSIASIPSEITRSVYIKETSLTFAIDEKVLARQVVVDLNQKREEKARQAERRRAQESLRQSPASGNEAEAAQAEADAARADAEAAAREQSKSNPAEVQPQQVSQSPLTPTAQVLEPAEKALLRLVVKYGLLPLPADFGTDASGHPVKVIDFVRDDMQADALDFVVPAYRKVFQSALELYSSDYLSAAAHAEAEALEKKKAVYDEGVKAIAENADNSADIALREEQLNALCEEAYQQSIGDFRKSYFEKHFVSDPDDTLRRVTTDLVMERYQLSRIFTRNNQHVETDEERIGELVERALIALKYDTLRCEFEQLRREIMALQTTPGYDWGQVMALMARQREVHDLCSQMAPRLGDRTIDPMRR